KVPLVALEQLEEPVSLHLVRPDSHELVEIAVERPGRHRHDDRSHDGGKDQIAALDGVVATLEEHDAHETRFTHQRKQRDAVARTGFAALEEEPMRRDCGPPLGEAIETGLTTDEDTQVLLRGDEHGSCRGTSVLHEATEEAGSLRGGLDGDEVGGDVE